MPVTLTEQELSIEAYSQQNFLRPVQRQELERSITDIEGRLAEPILLEIAGGDREALAKQLEKEQAMLERGTPPKLDAAGQRRVYAKMQKCEEMIVNGLPTFTMMERGRPQDVDHHVSHENAPHRDEDGQYTTKRAIQAWKNYRLTLDPHSIEPNFLSIASLRTDTVRGNPALFRKNYDHIRFREYIEEGLTEQLDDDTYFQFCGLKALDWSEATIKRKFDWTQKMYDVALERFCTDMHVPRQSTLHAENRQEDGDQPSMERGYPQVANPAYTENEIVDAQKGKAAPEHTRLKTVEPVKRAPNHPREIRVQIEPGWPQDELLKYNISVGEFCRAWGQKSNTLYYQMKKNGQWMERHLIAARDALEKLKKQRQAHTQARMSPQFGATRNVEPSGIEVPALVYDSTESVAAQR